MNLKEQWADEVLESFNGIKKAEPSRNLFEKITQNLAQEKQVKIIPLKQLRWIAAAACFVIGMNVLVFTSNMKYVTKKTIDNTENYQIINDYSLYK